MIKKELSSYFPYLEVKVWMDMEKIIGFSGVDENKLEMLFLDPVYIGKGYGKQIIVNMFEENKLQFIDVNEQNQSAKLFYQAMGFSEYAKSEVAGAGRAYPILHLKRGSKENINFP